jgi:hypothetical protein
MHLGKEWGGSRMLVEKNQKIICIVLFRILDIDFNATTNISIQHLPEFQKEALVVSRTNRVLTMNNNHECDTTGILIDTLMVDLTNQVDDGDDIGVMVSAA